MGARASSGADSGAEAASGEVKEQCAVQTHKMSVAHTGSIDDSGRISGTTGLKTTGFGTTVEPLDEGFPGSPGQAPLGLPGQAPLGPPGQAPLGPQEETCWLISLTPAEFTTLDALLSPQRIGFHSVPAPAQQTTQISFEVHND